MAGSAESDLDGTPRKWLEVGVALTWGTVKHISAGDVSGDGVADLLVVGEDGKLYYYPNNLNADPERVPFRNAAWSSAATWGTVKSVSAGDVSGDGAADLVTVGADGKLYYYPNNMNADAEHVPFRNATWASAATWANNRLAN